MIRFLAERLVLLAATLLIASVAVFALLEAAPGDPAAVILGLNASPDALAALRAELGLDGGLAARYARWLGGMLAGDFGVSYTYRVPVGSLIWERLEVSAPLAVLSLALAAAIAFPLGVAAAARRGQPLGAAISGFAQLGVAAPNFWVGILLVLIFAMGLGWTSAGGFPGWDAGVGAALGALTLPAIALALPQAAILTRVLRGALLDTLGEDYVRTARAKGLSEGATLRRHALRNALIPVLTILGLQFSFLLAGAVIIENVFFLPGLGRLALQGVAQRDLAVVKGVVMTLVFAVVLVNFIVDALYALVDPRVRAGKRTERGT
ncbi:MAG: ABC transporter permease [Pseudomonadota bacterium]